MNFMNVTTGAAPTAEPHPADRLFDPRYLWAVVVRRQRVIAAVFLLVAALVAAAMLLQPPSYRATALLMLNPSQRVVAAEQALNPAAPDAAAVDSAIEVLRSPRMSQRLAAALALDADPAWTDAATSGTPDPERPIGAALVERVNQAVDARRRSLSFVIEVSAEAPSAAQAAAMANTLVELYQQAQLEARFESSRRANVWLQQRVEELRVDVQQKEAAAATYRADSGLLSSQGSSLTELQVSTAQRAVLDARADLADKAARYQQVDELLRRGASPDSLDRALNSEVIRELRAREADQARQQAELEQRYEPLHPAVRAGRAELANIREQVAAEISRIAANLSDEVAVARARLATLQEDLTVVRAQLVRDDRALVRLNELERDAAASRAVYESFLQRYREISNQGNMSTSEATIASNAVTPRAPSSPNLPLALALAVMLGLVCAAGVALLLEQVNDTIDGIDDIERRTGRPVIASIPLVQKSALRMLAPDDRHPAGFMIEKPMSAFAEAFRVLRMAVTYANGDPGKSRVIAITSALPDEGKTTTSLCLARAAAMSGRQRVILVDCDLRSDALNQLFGIEPQNGLQQVLAGETDWRSVVGEDEPSGAHILPLAGTTFTVRDVFGTSAMRDLLTALRAEYDLIILDCAPLLVVAETRVLVTLADNVLLTGRWRKTPMRAVTGAADQVHELGASLLGFVVHGVDTQGGQYYGDALYFHHSSNRYYLS